MPSLLALLLMSNKPLQVRFCLDQFKEGEYWALKFSQDVYESTYRKHLANLQQADKLDPSFTLDLGREVFDGLI